MDNSEEESTKENAGRKKVYPKTELNLFIVCRRFFEVRQINTDMQLNCKPGHYALFFTIVYRQNTVTWQQKVLGIPRDSIMEQASMASRKTYYKCLDDLEKWGLIKVLEKGKNGGSSAKITFYTEVNLEIQVGKKDTGEYTGEYTGDDTGGGTISNSKKEKSSSSKSSKEENARTDLTTPFFNEEKNSRIPVDEEPNPEIKPETQIDGQLKTNPIPEKREKEGLPPQKNFSFSKFKVDYYFAQSGIYNEMEIRSFIDKNSQWGWRNDEKTAVYKWVTQLKTSGSYQKNLPVLSELNPEEEKGVNYVLSFNEILCKEKAIIPNSQLKNTLIVAGREIRRRYKEKLSEYYDVMFWTIARRKDFEKSKPSYIVQNYPQFKRENVEDKTNTEIAGIINGVKQGIKAKHRNTSVDPGRGYDPKVFSAFNEPPKPQAKFDPNMK